jgi:hypothetical protein
MFPRSRAGKVIATAASILLLTLATGGPASGAEKAIWGPTTLPDGSSAFALYDELGIDTLQLSVNWATVAPVRPAAPRDPSDHAYRWPPEIAVAAAQAAQHHIRLALLVTNAPPWANGGRAPIWAPSDPRDYADFLTAAARRYPAVRRWMIWGEPNKDDRFEPNRTDDPVSARTYAPLLDAAYRALKQRDPRNIVIGGMTWTNGTVKPRDFVRWLRLANGKPPRLDWFGHNPFPFRFPRLSQTPTPGGFRDISDMDTFSREVRHAYKRAVPLWLSEYTIQTARGSDIFATFVSEAGQAAYLTAGYRIADDLGPRVAGLGWVSLLDEPEAPGSANWGLLTNPLRPKPSFAAMVRAPSERLRPRVVVKRLRVAVTPRRDGVIRVELRRGHRRLARVSVYGRTGRRRTLRMRPGLRDPAGRYTVIVRSSSRAATVRRSTRVPASR